MQEHRHHQPEVLSLLQIWPVGGAEGKEQALEERCLLGALHHPGEPQPQALPSVGTLQSRKNGRQNKDRSVGCQQNVGRSNGEYTRAEKRLRFQGAILRCWGEFGHEKSTTGRAARVNISAVLSSGSDESRGRSVRRTSRLR